MARQMPGWQRVGLQACLKLQPLIGALLLAPCCLGTLRVLKQTRGAVWHASYHRCSLPWHERLQKQPQRAQEHWHAGSIEQAACCCHASHSAERHCLAAWPHELACLLLGLLPAVQTACAEPLQRHAEVALQAHQHRHYSTLWLHCC